MWSNIVCIHKCITIKKGYEMINKNSLKKMLNISYKDSMDEDLAWEAFSRFKKHIDNGDEETISYFLNIACLTETEILKLRTLLAEMGFELTPDQLSQYIYILTISLFEQAGAEGELNNE